MIGTPDSHFSSIESYMVFDHKRNKVYILEASTVIEAEIEIWLLVWSMQAELAQPAADNFHRWNCQFELPEPYRAGSF